MEIEEELLNTLHSGQLSIQALRQQTIHNTHDVDYICEPLTYQEFFTKYLLANKICVLGPWVTKGWQSRKDWVCEDGSANLAFIKQQFGDAIAPVADCGEEEYSTHPKDDMTVGQFVDYMEEYKLSGYKSDRKCLYLKDWHFVREFPDYPAYTTPEFFCSDWLNEFWKECSQVQDDYQFVYMGPKGSWTPFHCDVLRSYSWSANICGCKLWWIFPPGEEECLKDKCGHLAVDLRSPSLQDKHLYPNYEKCHRKLEVVQKAGEVIFVPSGWHHQVFNLEDTISINHNWLNGCNLDLSWAFLKASLEDVQHEIADCRSMEGWPQQCQIVLRACSGMDYPDFFRFLQAMAQRRLTFIESNSVPKCIGTAQENTDQSEQNVRLGAVNCSCVLGCSKHKKTSCNRCDNFRNSQQTAAEGPCVKCAECAGKDATGLELTMGAISFSAEKSCEEKNLSQEHKVTPKLNFPYYTVLNINHALFDLDQLQRVLVRMLDTAEVKELDWSDQEQSPDQLLKQIQEKLIIRTF